MFFCMIAVSSTSYSSQTGTQPQSGRRVVTAIAQPMSIAIPTHKAPQEVIEEESLEIPDELEETSDKSEDVSEDQ